jgi:hypothetical protein
MKWTLASLWGLLIGGAALWVLVGSVSYWVARGWLPNDAADWVQAIGSVVAIVSTGLFFVLDKRHQNSIRRKEDDLLLMKTVAVAKHAGKLGLILIEELRSQSPNRLELERTALSVRRYIDYMQQVTLDRMPGVKGTLAWLELQHCLFDLVESTVLASAGVKNEYEQKLLALFDKCINRAVARLVVDAAVSLSALKVEAEQLAEVFLKEDSN